MKTTDVPVPWSGWYRSCRGCILVVVGGIFKSPRSPKSQFSFSQKRRAFRMCTPLPGAKDTLLTAALSRARASPGAWMEFWESKGKTQEQPAPQKKNKFLFLGVGRLNYERNALFFCFFFNNALFLVYLSLRFGSCV